RIFHGFEFVGPVDTDQYSGPSSSPLDHNLRELQPLAERDRGRLSRAGRPHDTMHSATRQKISFPAERLLVDLQILVEWGMHDHAALVPRCLATAGLLREGLRG